MKFTAFLFSCNKNTPPIHCIDRRPSMDERLLVKRAKRGDTAAFAELYGTIYKRLYQFALYTLGNTQDAEDVVSAAVMEAFENIGKLRKERCFFRLDVSYRGKYV